MRVLRKVVLHRPAATPKRRNRRKSAPGAGRLERAFKSFRERRLSEEEVGAILRHVPGAEQTKCRSWLMSTLDLCWMLQREYAANKTKKEKVDRLTQVPHLSRAVDSWVLCQLMGARFRAQSKKSLAKDRLTIIQQGVEKWGRRIARELRRIDELISYELRHLQKRPENQDERRAAVSQASKPALEHLTLSIAHFWKRSVGAIEPGSKSPCNAFATAVYKAAGDPGASPATSEQRLRKVLGKTQRK